jgi:hypothetical protein
MYRLSFCLSLVLFLFAFERPAHAYLDPGQSSMFLHVIVGGIASCFMFVRLSWGKIKTFFSTRKRGNGKTQSEPLVELDSKT